MTDPTVILDRLERSLAVLEQRRLDAPSALVREIEEHGQAIELTRRLIDGGLSEAEWATALQPLLVTIEQRAATPIIAELNIGDVTFSGLTHSTVNTGNIMTHINAGGDVVGGDKVTTYHVTYQMVAPAAIDAETLTRARERLAALPLDRVPEPATLPPGSKLPYALNPHFVGREAELKELARRLKGGQTTAIGQIAAATGLGGIGKSQLAAAFAHRYGPYFAGGVYWLSFADPAAIPAEIAACMHPGGQRRLRTGNPSPPRPGRLAKRPAPPAHLRQLRRRSPPHPLATSLRQRPPSHHQPPRPLEHYPQRPPPAPTHPPPRRKHQIIAQTPARSCRGPGIGG